jgi:hypothetical protein
MQIKSSIVFFHKKSLTFENSSSYFLYYKSYLAREKQTNKDRAVAHFHRPATSRVAGKLRAPKALFVSPRQFYFTRSSDFIKNSSQRAKCSSPKMTLQKRGFVKNENSENPATPPQYTDVFSKIDFHGGLLSFNFSLASVFTNCL